MEIYKAWDKVKKEFVEFDLWFGLGSIAREDSTSDDYEILKPTGLIDRNGNDVWQKDFLSGVWDGYIDYCDKCKSLSLFWAIGCASCEGDVHWIEIAEDDGKLEVTGNILQNPDLMQ
uniref:Putative YopX protein n=1 Tax=viral metagenome TaxID=1070528 RepID=A0A6M3IM21_9ZZZZ